MQAQGLSTFFDAIGTPTGDCRMPTNDLTDDNGKALPFVALNINRAPGNAQDLLVSHGAYSRRTQCHRVSCIHSIALSCCNALDMRSCVHCSSGWQLLHFHATCACQNVCVPTLACNAGQVQRRC